MDKSDLGKKIRDSQPKEGYTQHALAEMAGISNVYLGEIEWGTTNIFLQRLSLHSFANSFK